MKVSPLLCMYQTAQFQHTKWRSNRMTQINSDKEQRVKAP